LRSDTPTEPTPEVAGAFPFAWAVALLATAGAGAAFVSDWFIHALRPAMDSLGVPDAFAGLVIVAIAGNAVENTAGFTLALKGESDLAISVVKNSVAQIAAFLFPALVLVSLFFATPLTFALAPVFVGALALTALALWQITSDGEATLFEGVALVATYAILAVVAWFE
ncbi:MAG: sodium:proton exchanger, partial [Gaiellaceae bacterium]